MEERGGEEKTEGKVKSLKIINQLENIIKAIKFIQIYNY